MFDLDTKEFFVSRDVKFFEDVYPFVSPDDVNIDVQTLVPYNDDFVHLDFAEFDPPHELTNTPTNASLPEPTNETPFEPTNDPPSPVSLSPSTEPTNDSL